MVENSAGLGAFPVVGAFGVPPWCGCVQAGRDGSLQCWGRFIPFQGADGSSLAFPGCSHSWLEAIGDANLWDMGSPASARACSPLWPATAVFLAVSWCSLYCCFSLWGEGYPPVGRWSPRHGVLHPLKHNFRSVSFLGQAIRPVWVLKCFLGLHPPALVC